MSVTIVAEEATLPVAIQTFVTGGPAQAL